MEAIDRAIKHFGSQAALAAALGVRQPTVSEWLRGDRQVPAERCPEIERATEGQVRCEELRPDVAWEVLREQSAPVPDTPTSAEHRAAPAAALHSEAVDERRLGGERRQSGVGDAA